MERKERIFNRGVVYKDIGKVGVNVFTDRNSKGHSYTHEALQVLKAEDNDWILFDRETDYEGLTRMIEGEVIKGENLRNLIEEKLFNIILDENCLGALSQDDISEKYCKGKLPTDIDRFIDLIVSCPVIDEDDL